MPRPTRRRRRGRFAPDLLESRRLLAAYPAFPIDAETSGTQSGARSAVDFRGRVTVVWEADDGSGAGVYGRRFESGGYALGDAFRLNDDVGGDQVSPRVAQAPDGGAVVAWWSGSQIDFRRYDSEGTPLGSAEPLPGTEGFSPSFELTEADASGFTLYAQGFHLQRYSNDGDLESATIVAGDADGWTTVESTDPRHATDRWLVWSRVRSREQGGTTVYDAQVLVAALGDAGELAGDPVQVVTSTTGSADPAVLRGFDPAILDAGPVEIAWREPTADGGLYRIRQMTAPRLQPSPWTLHSGVFDLTTRGEGSPMWAGMLKANQITVVYSPGGGEDAYTQTWGNYSPAPGGGAAWMLDSTAPLVEAEGGPFDSIELLSTFRAGAGTPYWILRRAESGDLIGQRVDAGPATAPSFPSSGMSVSESAGKAVAWLIRTGDLSQAASYDYAAAAGRWLGAAYTAIPGIDFVPTSGTVTFAPGRAEASFTITILDDHVPEGIKRIELSRGPAGTDPASWGYARSLTIQDSSPVAQRDLTFVSAGEDGFWSWNEVEGWRKLNDASPIAFAATPDRQVFASFGAAGLWSWDGLRGWIKLNDLGPEDLACGLQFSDEPWGYQSPNYTIFLDYGAAGLWSWRERDAEAGPAGWAKLNHVDPVQMAATQYSLFVDFGPGGVWQWHRPVSGESYTSISSYQPQAMAAYGLSLYLDYGPSGLWRWRDSGTNWLHVNAADPQAIAADPGGVTVDYGRYGLWRWTEAGGMSLLSTHDATKIAPAAGGSIYAGFGALGLMRWTQAGGWTRVNTVDPYAVAATLAQADAVLDYGDAGLWRWDPVSGWRRLDGGPRILGRM
ncbi:MAG: hypothetical protein BGO49_03930 [Planctomycetales bacterium 71-10]|nr:MAG: hypothetical protein BGO49_03930 [Planctomycetales bacterium 71-10]